MTRSCTGSATAATLARDDAYDDLTGTVLAGHHQPLRVWVLCLYFISLNLSNRQIAAELGLNASDLQAMTEQLRRGLVAKAPEVTLAGEVKIDEVYVVVRHKGQPAAVAKRGGLGRRRRLAGAPGCGTLDKDKQNKSRLIHSWGIYVGEVSWTN